MRYSSLIRPTGYKSIMFAQNQIRFFSTFLSGGILACKLQEIDLYYTSRILCMEPDYVRVGRSLSIIYIIQLTTYSIMLPLSAKCQKLE